MSSSKGIEQISCKKRKCNKRCQAGNQHKWNVWKVCWWLKQWWSAAVCFITLRQLNGFLSSWVRLQFELAALSHSPTGNFWFCNLVWVQPSCSVHNISSSSHFWFISYMFMMALISYFAMSTVLYIKKGQVMRIPYFRPEMPENDIHSTYLYDLICSQLHFEWRDGWVMHIYCRSRNSALICLMQQCSLYLNYKLTVPRFIQSV